MSAMPEKKYLKPYREAVARFGPGFRATLWNSREAQVLRFDIMIDLADFDGCTIVDAGCGPGDFAAHLLERRIQYKRFVGIDAMPEMIETANGLGLARAEFVAADFVTDQSIIEEASPDWITISGSLNTFDEREAKRFIKRCFELAAQGVVFNFLSNRPHKRWLKHETGPARRFDTVRLLDWAMDHTPRVGFRQDYLDGHDATILMRH